MKYLERKARREQAQRAIAAQPKPRRNFHNNVGKFGGFATSQSSDDTTGAFRHGKTNRRKITLPKLPWDE